MLSYAGFEAQPEHVQDLIIYEDLYQEVYGEELSFVDKQKFLNMSYDRRQEKFAAIGEVIKYQMIEMLKKSLDIN